MASVIYHPDTALGTRESLVVTIDNAVQYTLMPGVAVDVQKEHLAALETAIGAASGALATPVAPTLTITGGAAGSYTYAVVAFNDQGDTPESPTVNTTVGPTTLDGTHTIRVNFTQVANAGGYKVIRTAGGPSQGLIATLAASAVNFTDTGVAASAYSVSGTNPNLFGFVLGPPEL